MFARPAFSGINQTTWLFACVIGAWVFYITARGDLAKWLGLFGISGKSANVNSNGSGNYNLPALPNLPGVPSLAGPK